MRGSFPVGARTGRGFNSQSRRLLEAAHRRFSLKISRNTRVKVLKKKLKEIGAQSLQGSASTQRPQGRGPSCRRRPALGPRPGTSAPKGGVSRGRAPAAREPARRGALSPAPRTESRPRSACPPIHTASQPQRDGIRRGFGRRLGHEGDPSRQDWALTEGPPEASPRLPPGKDAQARRRTGRQALATHQAADTLTLDFPASGR